jgi:AcrR family transcriptional regulator
VRVTPDISDADGVAGGPRPAHRPSRQAEIVEAAIRVFSTKGLAGTTMNDVAEACGMSLSALYYHFANKEELFAEAVRSVGDELAALTAVGRDLPGTLTDVVRSVFDWHAAHPDRARLFFIVAPGSTPEMARLWEEFIDAHIRGLGHYFPRPKRPRRADNGLAARTSIITASSAMTASLAGGVFGKRSTSHDVADATVAVIQRLMGPNT